MANGGGTEGRTDRRTDGRLKFPLCSTGHRPFGAAAQKGKKKVTLLIIFHRVFFPANISLRVISRGVCTAWNNPCHEVTCHVGGTCHVDRNRMEQVKRGREKEKENEKEREREIERIRWYFA